MPSKLVAGIVSLALLVPGAAAAARNDGIDATILAPGLVQAAQAVDRLERLTEEAEAIATALFRVHNDIGERRAAAAERPDCSTPWLLDLGARSREFGRACRDAVQSARVQARRVENMTVEPTIQPLLDPETSHRMSLLLTRVDELVRRYPEAAAWQQAYVEPLLAGCEPGLVPAPGLVDAAPNAVDREVGYSLPTQSRRSRPIAVLAFGGGWLCPGAVPAAGVMLVSGEICYSSTEDCDCEPVEVAPATVLGPETKAGSAN